ncbi:zinc-dependent alcohol dehydrogenase [Solibacillus silvestris]|uniref:zinc-dependent alcohol dehydrogenase n=1 Tax=Solibacillus silvestris TaxID=76853 RepID=UPI003F81F5BB
MRALQAHNRAAKIVEIEQPTLFSAGVLVETKYTAVSPGTERLLIEGSKDSVRQLGYSAVGVVRAIGEAVANVRIGDIVACYGAPYVGHMELMVVPETLVAKCPANVALAHASLAAHGTIAIHAIRQAQLQFGESVVVIGLGVLGQMIAKICAAASYDVICYEPNMKRAAMLKDAAGIEAFSDLNEMEQHIKLFTNGQGADAVLLCAGGKHSETTARSLEWVRKQGRIVIVGDVEPQFNREQLFAKEAIITISRAGGPGRYDARYEKDAIDYPYHYVRWTEGRNLAAYIRLLERKAIDVADFVQLQIPFAQSANIYEQLAKDEALTAIIDYTGGN